MTSRTNRARTNCSAKTATPILAGAFLTLSLATGCFSDPLAPGARTATPVIVRLENATASTIEVIVEALDAAGEPIDATSVQAIDIPVVTIGDGGVSFGVLDPIGAGAAVANGTLLPGGLGLYDTSADVRVPGFAVSDGVLYCSSLLRITTQVDNGDTPISLSGAGTGTPSFDEGSVGETGERYFRAGIDFECGQTIVVRAGQDVNGAASSTAGAVAVIDASESSPFGPVVNPGTGDGEVAPTTVAVEVENRGSVIGTLRLEVTTSSGDPQEFTVTVPPDAITTGSFACGTSYKLTATYPDPETPEDQDTERIVILSGDGTGSLGFDEASVSRTGERYLVIGTHVSCGDTVHVILRDDISPIGFSGIGAFSGTVTVIGE